MLISVILFILLLCGYFIGKANGAGIWGLIIAFIISFLLILFSYFKADKVVLAASAARLIEKKDNPQFFNVVEEMSIAAGLPMPNIYVIEDTAPNAFACGRKPQLASIAVTTGLLSKLNRDELQGVIAHEMSHIKNYDILYATLICILVGTIALLCDTFRRSLRYGLISGRGRRSTRSSSSGPVLLVIFIVAVVLSILAPVFAQILQFAISRQREYLADASAAQLTRYPEGLARALEKIANDKEVLEVANRATQHLYIVNPIKPFEARAQNNIFSTHPPIEERIRRLRAM
ncbi:MAG: M48 family metallopeptidase [Candidatus Omnitrophica bacterium]|nr:M48 family metallopeptidase [Candidatus Omnitrophota bacterium]